MYELPAELSWLTELFPEPENQTLLILNFQCRTNYPHRSNLKWFCPTWRMHGNPVSSIFILKNVGPTCHTASISFSRAQGHMAAQGWAVGGGALGCVIGRHAQQRTKAGGRCAHTVARAGGGGERGIGGGWGRGGGGGGRGRSARMAVAMADWRARLERGGEADGERRRRQGGVMSKRQAATEGVGAAGATLSSPPISLPFPFLPRLPISISSPFCGAGSHRP